MKRVAIIGSESFLARNFIKYAVTNELDYQFELYDCCEGNVWEGIPYSRIDFNSVEDIKKIDFTVDTIMIYIGKTGTTSGFDDYRVFVEVNEIMLLNILRAYVEKKSNARIIYPSSRLVFKSNELGLIAENGERECKSIYAITKQAAEEYLKLYYEAFGIESVIIRICTPIGSLLEDFGTYGTFEIFKNQAINKKKITVFGDGLQRKTFTSITDICKAFSKVIDSRNIKYHDYNLGGQALSLINIAEKIADEYDVSIVHSEWPEMHKSVDGGSVVFDSSRFDDEFNMSYEQII